MPRRILLVVCVLAQIFASGVATRAHGVQASGVIAGRVETAALQAPGRAPVRRAKVTLMREGSNDTVTTRTDSEARFRFEGLVPGRYAVAVEKPGFVSNISAPIEVIGTEHRVDVALVLGAALEGRLQDNRNAPITRELVTADRLNAQGAASSSYVATTDDLGRFRIHSLPAGRYRLRANPVPPASGQEHFFPGTTAAAEARLIDVAAGVTTDRLEFVVPIAPLSPIAAAAIESAPATNTVAVDPKAARVTGIITRSDSGLPIANAIARLTDANGVVRRADRTGDDGRFEIAAVGAGVWTLTAIAGGYVAADAAPYRSLGTGLRVAVREGDRIRQDIALVPMGAIEGRVLDEFGDPAPGVIVQVAQKDVVAGVARLVTSPNAGHSATTDDRGSFRVQALFPDEYYLILVPHPFAESWMTGFAPTFFPGTVAVESAVSIPVVPGRDVYDIRFAFTPSRTASVLGHVVDAMGQLVEKAQIMLVPVEDGEVRATVIARGAPNADGTFSFNDVPVGNYVVQTMGPGVFGVASVTVDAVDREYGASKAPLKVVAKPLSTARGRVLFEGDSPAPAAVPLPRDFSISFQPTDFTTGPLGSIRTEVIINRDWSFEIPNVASQGVLGVIPPSGWALARIRHEGRDITDTPFDFQSADVGGLEVILTNRLGTVSGTVTAGGRPVPTTGILVMGADDASWIYLGRTMRVAATDDRGLFTMNGLLPGRYVAVPVSADQVRFVDHASLLALRSAGVPFTVSERANTVVTLTLPR